MDNCAAFQKLNNHIVARVESIRSAGPERSLYNEFPFLCAAFIVLFVVTKQLWLFAIVGIAACCLQRDRLQKLVKQWVPRVLALAVVAALIQVFANVEFAKVQNVPSEYVGVVRAMLGTYVSILAALFTTMLLAFAACLISFLRYWAAMWFLRPAAPYIAKIRNIWNRFWKREGSEFDVAEIQNVSLQTSIAYASLGFVAAAALLLFLSVADYISVTQYIEVVVKAI